jgi:filamentous hemagglutinin
MVYWSIHKLNNWQPLRKRERLFSLPRSRHRRYRLRLACIVPVLIAFAGASTGAQTLRADLLDAQHIQRQQQQQQFLESRLPSADVTPLVPDIPATDRSRYENDEEQYRALMSNAVTFAKKFKLVPGIALTAQQMAQLTSDIVWLVEQTVTLPDGTKQRVLAPQVYVKTRKGDLRGDGALIAADTIKLDADTIYNSGTVAGRQLVNITADSIRNMAGGRINASQIDLAARDDIRVIGGAITAEQTLKLQAGRDIDIASTLSHSDSRSGQDRYQYTGIDRLAGLYVTGAQQPGQLHVQAGRNLTLTAAAVANAGKADESSTTLQAGNDLALKTLTTAKSDLVVSDARNFVKRASSQEVGTQIASEGDIRMRSANDVTLRAADVTSQQGAVVVQAGRDIGIQAGSSELSGTLQNYESKRSGLATKSSVIKSDVQRQTLQGSAVSGNTVSLLAGRDLSIVASDVVSDNNTTLIAKNNLRVP